MKKIKYHLILSATHGEVNHLLSETKANSIEKNIAQVSQNIICCIGGIGTINTILSIEQMIHQFGIPESIINIGVCGSYNPKISLCEIVQVSSDILADRVIEDNDKIKFWSNSGFELDLFETFSPTPPVFCKNNDIKKVKGITSDRVAGNIETIQWRKTMFSADVESMEGASAFLMAQKYNIKACQFRAVSNYVEPRNKNNWQLTNAIGQLNRFVLDKILEQL